jgi:hypothetical protein
MHGTDLSSIEDAWVKDAGNLVRIREISRLGAVIGFIACGDMPTSIFKIAIRIIPLDVWK